MNMQEKQTKKVLIFPAGTEIGLEIFNSLKYSKFVEIYGGTSSSDHSSLVYKHLIDGFPFYSEPGFVDYLNKIIKRYALDYIYPAHDAVQYFLMEHEKEIRAKIVSTAKETVEICRSKKRTYCYLRERGESWFLPEEYYSVEEVSKFPVFVKPAVGQGSSGAERIDDKEALLRKLTGEKEMVICEFLPGEEYTVDCFTDKDGRLRFVSIRNRERIRLGISVHSRVLPLNESVKRIAETLNRNFEFNGAWFFQLKKNIDDEYRLMEVSPRIPGTVGVTRNKGVNFPLLTLYNMWGMCVDILCNSYDIVVDRAFINRYDVAYDYDKVYVDFDDTLIIDKKVNVQLLAFLYQSVSKGREIILLTKHVKDIMASLKEYHISYDLFSEIIVLKKDDQKSDYIISKKAIFIDDSFAERKLVADICNIPVIDLDMVESLIDWRR